MRVPGNPCVDRAQSVEPHIPASPNNLTGSGHANQPQSFVSPLDYLAWERAQETRHEYFDGEVFAMTGASRPHNLVCGDTFAGLHAQLRGGPCEVYANDMRVKVSVTDMYTYPDIVVACGEPRFEDAAVDTLLNQALIIEVLSDSTERYDRGAKFAHYRTLPSLKDYLLVTPTQCRVEHDQRQDADRWLMREYRQLEDQIECTSIQAWLRLAEMYERVSLEPCLQKR